MERGDAGETQQTPHTPTPGQKPQPEKPSQLTFTDHDGNLGRDEPHTMLVVLLCSPVISYSLGGVISYSLGGVRAHVHRRDDVVASTMQVFESE